MDKAILFGNGLNIKFGGNQYSNQKILLRGLNFLRQDKKVQKIFPIETVDLLYQLYYAAKDILAGKYDSAAEDVEEELQRFKKVYSKIKLVDVGSIGMEDYFLILHLLYRFNYMMLQGSSDNVIFNQTRENEALECFRDLCLMGIYNNGKINKLHKRYSQKFIDFLNSFDFVFTTNYDLNLDEVFHNNVHHLHGRFDVLSEIYDPDSFRNSLSDHPFKSNKLINIKKYNYLQSTALMNYSGKNKYQEIQNRYNLNHLKITQIELVPNSMVSKKDKQLAIEIKRRQMEDPSLGLQEPYEFKEYKNFRGELSIIGLSPSNDNHIFSDRKTDVDYIYYFFSEDDLRLAKKVLPDSSKFRPVKLLWNELAC